MPNFPAESFFLTAGMVVARGNLTGSVCGTRDEKVADPGFKWMIQIMITKKLYKLQFDPQSS